MSRFRLHAHQYAIILVMLAAFGLVTFLYYKSETVDYRDHERFVTELGLIQAADARLNEYVLRLRSGTLANVDPLNRDLESLRLSLDALADSPTFLRQAGLAAVGKQLRALRELLKRKEALVERFKAENANLQTSLSYFPVLVRQIIERAEPKAGASDLVQSLYGLLRDVLLFNLNNEQTMEAELYARVLSLESHQADYEGLVSPRTLENALVQARTILKIKPAVDGLVEELIGLPAPEYAERLAQAYNRYYEYALRTTNFYRLWLYIACVVLLLYVAWLIIRHLERRVAMATAQVEGYNERLKRQLRDLQAMGAVSLTVSSVMDVEKVLDTIMDLSKEVMGAEAGSLLLLDDTGDKLRFHVAKGSAADTLKNVTVEMGQGMVGHVAATGRPLLVKDAYQDNRFDPSYDRLSGFQTRSMMTVPLRAKEQERVIGVLQVINKRHLPYFDEYDLHLFESFAAQASVALENARLYARTKAIAEDLRATLERERNLTIEKEKMGKFIPKDVVDEISRNREKQLALGGRTICASVLFSDIKGFTRLSETLDPHEVVRFLNVYMTAMTEIIEEEGGIVDKFIGDGIMAVFTDRRDRDHALRAARAGVCMQRKLGELRDQWQASQPEVCGLQMRVGINTGMVVAGNIGSQTRMDYTVVGDNVNVASRIEGACQPGMVYVSAATQEDIGDRLEAIRMDPIQVKNRVQPVHIYAISAEEGRARR
ncbi:MAG: GAF domain-containing protein [Chromatiales bacterium]|nr:GAF domain-containing protein [Chromatiales bacterium]